MKRFRLRFGFREVFLAAIVIAYDCTVLRGVCDLSSDFFFETATAVLAAALVMLVTSRGSALCFWSGFCLAGWSYLFVTFNRCCASFVRPFVPTSWIVEYACRLHYTINEGQPCGVVAASVSLIAQDAGHALACLHLATAAGLLTRCLFVPKKNRELSRQARTPDRATGSE